MNEQEAKKCFICDRQPIKKEGGMSFYVDGADTDPQKGLPWESCLKNSRRKLEEDNNA